MSGDIAVSWQPREAARGAAQGAADATAPKGECSPSL